MSLREIARFTDVYEAELAAAFLASHGLEVIVTERFQTTMDPLMQRALGNRLVAPASIAEEARLLLARVRAGEFADAGDCEEDAVDSPRRGGVVLAGMTLLALLIGGGYLALAATGLRGPMRPVRIIGLAVIAILILAPLGVLVAQTSGLLG